MGFDELPQEKREAILNAGYKCFGKLGYRKASTADIAREAGISKAMVFHYFGSKKDMYLKLIDSVFDEFSELLGSQGETSRSDFFERVYALSKHKIDLMKSHSLSIAFVLSTAAEEDPEVKDEIKSLTERSTDFRTELMLTDLDRMKFKDGVQPELVLDLLVGYSYGIVGRLSSDRLEEIDFDDLMGRVSACMEMLRQNLYKPEYL